MYLPGHNDNAGADSCALTIVAKHCAMAATAVGGRRVTAIKDSFRGNGHLTVVKTKIAATLSAMTTTRFSNGMITIVKKLRSPTAAPTATGDR